jgi:hypothetical protein
MIYKSIFVRNMKMKNIIVICLIASFHIACKKTPEVSVENDQWKLLTTVDYDAKNASYCNSNGELLLIRSLNSYSLYGKNHEYKANISYDGSPSYGYRTFPMVNNIFISIGHPENLQVNFQNITNKNDFGAFYFGNDSNVLSFDDPHPVTNEPAYIGSPSGVYVFKHRDKTGNIRLSIADIKNYLSIKGVSLPISYSNIVLHFYDGGKFYFSDNTNGSIALYTMDSTGQYQKIANQAFFKLTKVKDVLYGINSSRQLYLSYDGGYAWTKSTVEMHTFNLINIAGTAMYFRSNIIAELRLDGTVMNEIQYNAKGLEGNEITWICKHNDRYYCTTKSGVYYIEERFFMPL